MEQVSQGQRSSSLSEHMENYNVEALALHRKLQSKTEALKIMRAELEKFRAERDQKLMVETLQLRYSTVKRNGDYSNLGFGGKSSLIDLLNETRENNIKLNTQLEASKQRLHELQGDIDILRRNQQSSTSVMTKQLAKGKESHPDWKTEKGHLIMNMETLKKKNAQLTFDLKALIDEKEETVSERDAYKCKSHRLNHELMVALNANESHKSLVDIDDLILENKYLQEKLNNCQDELELVQQACNKYKTMLETKRKNGIIKLGANNTDNIISHKQVKALMDSGVHLPTKTETTTDMKSLCVVLLDNLNDKTLALNHQKKTNKILATRITELEYRIQRMSGSKIDKKYSPSDILLNGYCSSNVDEPKSLNITEDSGTMSSDESNKTSQVCDDGVDSLSSTESNRSIVSSEYGNIVKANDPEGSAGSQNASESEQQQKDNTAENETLQELPVYLAEMLQKALEKLETSDEESDKLF